MAGYGDSARRVKRWMIWQKSIITEHEELNLFITLGQGINTASPTECMNKMKEMGLSNSGGLLSLEYRHGLMSLVDENTPIIF